MRAGPLRGKAFVIGERTANILRSLMCVGGKAPSGFTGLNRSGCARLPDGGQMAIDR